MKNSVSKATDTATANGADWENGTLGRDENHVRRSTLEREAAVDAALGLKLISVRLEAALIDKLKFIASHNGVGYQPLIRDVLNRFARSEFIALGRELSAQAAAEKQLAQAAPTGKRRRA
jgi:predicted DNA binding CopG/RHH family protein